MSPMPEGTAPAPDDDCVFCAIVRGDLPSERVAEDDATLAFMDINPGTEGHLLVIPKAHSRDLHDISADDLTAVTLMSQQMAARVVERLGADGVNLLNCTGEAAWQTVFHFHMHVVPRYAGQPGKDDIKLPWIPTPGDPERIAAAAAQLAG